MTKVLIVDDQKDIRSLIRMTLEFEDGLDVQEAENGAQALDTIRVWNPDIVLLDVMIPGLMNGLDVCKKLKGSTPSPKVVMLTARGQARDIEEGAKCGADLYIVKPFSPMDLVDKITDLR
jgi:two-component system phosphate regulon response regulator PhoB